VSEETPREALARKYQNGGLTYAEYEREMNALAVEEYTPPNDEPLPEDASGVDQAEQQPGQQYDLNPEG